MATAPDSTQALADAELEELCRLLIGCDRDRLRETIERLSTRGEFVDLQSETLADAMRLALARDPEFSESMGTMISKGVHTTVQRDSAAFGRALAPAMGPAIRSAVLMMLEGFVQSIENVVDQQLSWRSLRWRMEAWRKKRSFAEIAFLHTLLFRVEHVFLVHRTTGLELLHVARPGAIAREPDLIASMLTAIQDFVRDAFDAPSTDSVTSFQVGELNVVVENGNHAAMAAVVRGQSRAEIRAQLRQALDRIEVTMAQSLAKFDGETEEFEAVRSHVEGCLLESELSSATKKPERKSGALRWALATVALALLTWWIIALVATAAQQRRLDDFVAALRTEPGYVVTAAEATDSGLLVRGLCDPLARAFDELARKHNVDALATAVLEPYHALHPQFVAPRVRKTMAPPPTIDFDLRGTTLVVRGRADHAWLERSSPLALAVPGVDAIDLSACEDTDLSAWQQAAARLLALDPAIATMQRLESTERRQFAALVRELTIRAIRLDRSLRIQAEFVWWSVDESGAAAGAARDLTGDLARQHGITIELVGYKADPAVRDGTLRLTAQLIE